MNDYPDNTSGLSPKMRNMLTSLLQASASAPKEKIKQRKTVGPLPLVLFTTTTLVS